MNEESFVFLAVAISGWLVAEYGRCKGSILCLGIGSGLILFATWVYVCVIFS